MESVSLDETPLEEEIPLGSKESRERDAERIRQDFIKSKRLLISPQATIPASEESGLDGK
jgi:hypothetical protein